MSERCFTIGHTVGYDKALATEPIVTKIGRRDGYEGGSVWRTVEEAFALLDRPSGTFTIDGKPRAAKDFSVYEVELPNGWESDTVNDGVDPWGCANILVDARVTSKVLR